MPRSATLQTYSLHPCRLATALHLHVGAVQLKMLPLDALALMYGRSCEREPGGLLLAAALLSHPSSPSAETPEKEERRLGTIRP